MLVEIGFKEIEISFPCASDTEWAFTRHLVETPGAVPEDVWIQVLVPSKTDLISRTVEAIRGARKAILHFYVASSPQFQDLVLGMSEDETIELVVKCAKQIRSLTKDYDPDQNLGTQWALQFSLEAFQATKPDFAIKICEAVKAVWQPTEDNPIIFTLAATVESASPNVYADQIEYFSSHISERRKVVVCAHPHNDRGCAVAAAEQAQLAGADRVEGCLFGNGERTGNVDLVTLALNLYTQGISPGLDFSNLNEIASFAEHYNHLPVHPRAPYAGRLVYCTFAGSHQDGIKKGWRERSRLGDCQEIWNMPYIPIDPADVGREEEAIIRISSQSGRSGGAWIVEQKSGLDLPRALQVHFLKLVKKFSDHTGCEMLEHEVLDEFENAYLFSKSTSHSSLHLAAGNSDGILPNFSRLTQADDGTHSTPNGSRKALLTLENGVSTPPVTQNSPLSDLENELLDTLSLEAKVSLNLDAIIQNVNERGWQLVKREAHKQKLERDSHWFHVSYVEGTSNGVDYAWGIGIHRESSLSLVHSVHSFIF